MAVSAPVGKNVPEPDSARLQTERVLASDIFRDSPIQQRLLRFLVDQSLAGAALDLKEYTIGSAVFGRREDFDPRTDSIVRVQIGVLRKKLAAYYAGPGSADEYVVEVPKGHYTPQFTVRKSPPVTAVPPVSPRPVWVYLVAGILAGGLAAYVATKLINSNATAQRRCGRRSGAGTRSGKASSSPVCR